VPVVELLIIRALETHAGQPKYLHVIQQRGAHDAVAELHAVRNAIGGEQFAPERPGVDCGAHQKPAGSTGQICGQAAQRRRRPRRSGMDKASGL